MEMLSLKVLQNRVQSSETITTERGVALQVKM